MCIRDRTYNEQSVPEQVKRGDLEFVKVSDGDLKRLEGVPFTITSLTTGAVSYTHLEAEF